MAGRVKIAIVGYTEHRNQAPFDHDEWEIWGLNDLYFEMPHTATNDRLRWFQIHPWRRHLVPVNTGSAVEFSEGPPHPRDPNHVPWLKATSEVCPLYVMREAPELPNALVLPRDKLFQYFTYGNGSPIRYFTNSISWMIAMAIMELAPDGPGRGCVEGAEIGVFGVDMMVDGGAGSEYGWQRPSCEFFLGAAFGAGIKITIPQQSDLLKCAWQYGDEEHEYFRVKVQDYGQMMEQRRIQAANAKMDAMLAERELLGARNAARYFERSHMPGDPGEAGPGRAPVPNSHKAPEA